MRLRPVNQFRAALLSVAFAVLTSCVPLSHEVAPISSNLRPQAVSDEEFIGPFPTWANVVRDFGAKGDGIQDDTEALQAAFDDIGKNAGRATVYLPAGTYRITKTLTIHKKAFFKIVGAHPEQVTLRWDGAPGTTMIQVSNSWRLGFGRIRFDGAGKAGVGLWLRWDRRADTFFPERIEVADCIFSDLKEGVQGGEDFHLTGYQDTADGVTIKRSRFYRASIAGVLLRDWNTLNWFISECLFEDNQVGLLNVIGGAHVYHSVFRRSGKSDIFVSNDLDYMSLRDNYSSGSRRFFATTVAQSGFALTVQRNVVIGTTEAPINMGWGGAILLLDNQFAFNGPAVEFNAGAPVNLVSVGNRFTSLPSANAEGKDLRGRALQDLLVARIDAAEPEVPAFAPRFRAPVLEVTKFTGAAIQDAIENADRNYRGKRPVVHLPEGIYSVVDAVTIPAGSDVRLVGDGFLKRTVLNLHKGVPGPTLRIDGPSRAQLIDIDVRGTASVVAVDIVGADTPGGTFFLDQVEINGPSISDIGIDFDGLDYLSLEIRSAMISSGKIGVRVTGGPRTSAAAALGARVDIFGGEGTSAGRDGPAWLVRNGGRLVVQDYWFEDNSARPVALDIERDGVVTFHGGHQHSFSGDQPSSLNMLLKGVTGRVSLLGIRAYGQHLLTAGTNPAQDVLFLGGCLCPQNTNRSTFVNLATAGRAAVLYTSTLSNMNMSHALAENHGPDDDNFLLDMLAQSRLTHWRRFGAFADGATDIRFYRVGIDSAATGIRIH